MKLSFDHRFFNFLSRIKTFSPRMKKVFKAIAYLLKWKAISYPLKVLEFVFKLILILPIPIYSHLVYLFVKHCTGFLGYYLRALYYSWKAKTWGGNILIDEDVILENIGNYNFDEFVQIDKRVIIACEYFSIGKGTHVAMGTIIGKGGTVIMRDYSGISYGCILIPASEEVNSGYRTGSMIPYNERCIKKGWIILEKESLIFSGCIIFPNAYISNGAVASAGTIVKRNIPEWKIAFGEILKDRKKIKSEEPKY